MTELPQGLLNLNLDDLLKPVEALLPAAVTDIIKGAVESALPWQHQAATTAPTVTPVAPAPAVQAALPADTGLRADAVKAIDTAIAGIALLLKFAFIIPDQYEAPLKALSDALAQVKGWLD